MLGFLVFDKPAGLSSHDIVGMTRAVTGIKKIGHTGTLDPFATGVLPLAIGPATRLIQYLDERVKVYDATLQLGHSTTTGDPEGEVLARAAVPALTGAHLDATLAGFLGPQLQTPPRYSAVKIDGRPLYSYARKGQDVTAKPRPIRIDRIDVIEHDGAHLRLRVRCGRGTYIRVLAEDIARALGTEGHLVALRREQSGGFSLDGALTASALSELVADTPDWPLALRRRRGEERLPWADRSVVQQALAGRLLSPLQALSHLSVVELDAGEVGRVRNGGQPPPPPDDGEHYALAHRGELIALAHRTERGPRLLMVIPASA
jgi:tRNA pseudouridine(55) synthase